MNKNILQIKAEIEEALRAKERVLSDENLIELVSKVAELSVAAFRKGNKILLCGNGGSAADAQHIAAELSGRFHKDRDPLFAEALHVNSSYLTSVANDYSFDEVYARLVKGMGRDGDILVAISTSGNSVNVVKAARMAKSVGMTVIGMTGEKGGELSQICDVTLKVPSTSVPRIQEIHILFGHILCNLIEQTLFPES